MKNLKKNGGITLVALVITIIILLILAGISISALTNQGLFKQAQNAKNLTEEKTAEENAILTNYLEQMNAIIGGQMNEETFDSETAEADVIKNWLKCIRYSNVNLDENSVMENEELLNTLMNSNEAVDYMIRSKNKIMPLVINSEIGMKQLGLSQYATTKFLADEEWKSEALVSENAIKGLDESNPVTIPKLTSNTSPSGIASAASIYQSAAYMAFGDNYTSSYGQYGCISSVYSKSNWWIQYEFDDAVWMYKCSFTFTAGQGFNTTNSMVIELSNDGNNWVTATDTISSNFSSGIGESKNVVLTKNNMQKYKYIRLRITQSTNCDTCGFRQIQVYAK